MAGTTIEDRAPSTHGRNGTHAETPSANGRDNKGRFTKGNTEGHGNPFGRKVAALRAAFLDSITEKDMQELADVLMFRAKGGDAAAARLLLAYAIGKPAAAADPDRVDVDEWRLMQQTAAQPEEMERTLHGMPVDMANGFVRATLPAIGRGIFDKLSASLKKLDERDHRRAERKRLREERKQARRQLKRGAAPSTDGPNGRAAATK